MEIAILQRLKPEADVGQYGAAYRFLEAAVGLAGVAMSVLAPVLSRSYSESRELLQRRTHRTFHLLLLIALPVAVIGAMIAWRLLPALPGFARFHGGGVALSILAPTASLILVGTIVQGLLVSGHEQRRLLVIASIGFILNLLLNIALIVPFSYVGAAIATTLTEVGLVLVSLREVRRRLGLALVPPRTANVIVATALLALVTVPGFFVDPYAQLAIALVAYVPALLVTRAVRPADLRGLARRDRPRPGALEPSPPSA